MLDTSNLSDKDLFKNSTITKTAITVEVKVENANTPVIFMLSGNDRKDPTHKHSINTSALAVPVKLAEKEPSTYSLEKNKPEVGPPAKK